MSLLDRAIAEVSQLNSGEKFSVKDLFKGYVWNREPAKDRQKVGVFFFEEVKNGKLKNLVRDRGKNSANMQMYEKI